MKALEAYKIVHGEVGKKCMANEAIFCKPFTDEEKYMDPKLRRLEGEMKQNEMLSRINNNNVKSTFNLMLTDSIDSSTTGRGSVVELVVMIKKQTLRTCNFLWSNVSQVL